MQNIGITKKNFLRDVLSPSCWEQLKISTLRLSLIFVPANHKQLSLPFIAWKSLEKVLVYKAASGKAVNQMASDWSWSHLNIGPALWLEVVPLWKTRGNLTVQNPSGRQPLYYIDSKRVRIGSLLDNRTSPDKLHHHVKRYNYVSLECFSVLLNHNGVCKTLFSLLNVCSA